ncbi:MAG: hypothetical protein IJ003_03555 [Candidatus Gastranaerophilales bacterium]|nr:hypothetical protein [Candidatus Gastranaerophilales bacterium]
MRISFLDRCISVLAYFTFGIFSIVWLVFANLTRKHIEPFLSFNLYQAIFISVVLAIFSLIYSIAINFLNVIPFVNKIARVFDIFFNHTPMFLSYNLSGLLVTLLVLYLSFFALIGKKPYVPIISDIVKINIGG